MKVKISEIKSLQDRRREINNISLSEIEFIDDNGKTIEIDHKILDEYEFTGLNNIDFIDLDFYLEGFKEVK
jgi:hypothetical protein